LRSFDRIPFTQQIIDQEQKSGIDITKADIALSLDQFGLDSFGDDGKVTVSTAPEGDALDFVAHHSKGLTTKKSELAKVDDLFSWNERTSDEGKHQKVNQVLSAYEAASVLPKVSPSIAQDAMETGKNVSDRHWTDGEQDAVKNFITEELYIHAKVLSFLYSR
jgi:hypothetical protein